MKKLLIIACMGLLVAGCGASKVIKETKICTYNLAGIATEYKMEAENDIIKKIHIGVELPSYLFDRPSSIFELSEVDKEIIGKLVLSQMGLKEGEGISTNIDIKGKDLIAIVTFELDKIDSSVFRRIEVLKDSELSKTVEGFKDLGAKCR